MEDNYLPKNNLDIFLPGMTRDFKNYVDVLPPEAMPRHSKEDPLVNNLSLDITRRIKNNS